MIRQRRRCGGPCPTTVGCATSPRCWTRRSVSARAAGSSGSNRCSCATAPACSATAQLLDAEGQVSGYAKAYGDRDTLEVAEHYNRVAGSMTMLDAVRTPRALGWARPDRIVVLEPMPGRPWTQLPVDVQPVAMRQLGAALANVHSLPTSFGRGPLQRYRPERIVHSADLVGLARDDVAADVRHLGDRLADEPPGRAPVVNLHGDLRSENVLFQGDEVHIVHIDRGGSGPAAVDLGERPGIGARVRSDQSQQRLSTASAAHCSMVTARSRRCPATSTCVGTPQQPWSPSGRFALSTASTSRHWRCCPIS